MSSKILINTITGLLVAGALGGPATHYAGDQIDDTNLQTLLTAAGGVLADATDTTVAAAAAIVAKLRASGQADEGSTTRLMMAAYAASTKAVSDVASAEKIVHVTIDIPLATIIAKTSGTAFDIGSALPTNAKLVGAPQLNVITALSGGSLSAATAAIQKHGDAAGSLNAAVTVFTGAASTNSKPGTNPYFAVGGSALAMTLTATGDTLANVAAGHLSVDVLYSILA